MDKNPKIGTVVTVNDLGDAPLYRVDQIGRNFIGIASLERVPRGKKIALEFVSRSILQAPTVEQLSNALIEAYSN